MGHAKIYSYTKFEDSNHTRYQLMKGVQNLQIGPQGFHHAPFWGILSCIWWNMPISICTPNLKFLATPVTNLWKGVQNLQIWPRGPHHTPFWGILSCIRWDMTRSICTPNLKFLATPVTNLWKGYKIYKFGHGAPTTPPFGVFCHALDGTWKDLFVHQIWSF